MTLTRGRMRIPRVGYLFVIAAAITLFAPAATPAATPAAAGPSFKVMISPEYATAGQPTTFHLTVVNTSSPGTTVGSVKVTPPAGFAPPHPTPGAPLRRKTKVLRRTLTLTRISLDPGKKAKLTVTAIAPRKCGRSV